VLEKADVRPLVTSFREIRDRYKKNRKLTRSFDRCVAKELENAEHADRHFVDMHFPKYRRRPSRPLAVKEPKSIRADAEAAGGKAAAVERPEEAEEKKAREGRGNAKYFDGIDDYVDMGQVSASSVTSGTFEAWVKAKTMKSAGILDADTCGGNSIGLHANGKIYSRIWECYTASPSSSISSSARILAGTWYHIARTWTPTTHRIYINGRVVASVAKDSKAINAGGLRVHIGHRHSNGADRGQFFNGHIHGVRVWKVARSQAQIESDMNKMVVGNETGLLGHWH